MKSAGLDDRMAQERRQRLAAERLLAQKSEELYAANKRLSDHANALSYQVIEQREQNAELQGLTTLAQARLEVATEKATVAERRLWEALEAIEDGFAIFDKDWRMIAANPAYTGLFEGIADIGLGCSYDTVLRIAVDEGFVDLEGVSPDDWVDLMIARLEADPIPEKIIKLWNGAYIRLLDKRTPEGDVVSLALNITGTIRRENDLRQARDQAEAATRAKSAFLANMSHEIRTPMNGVVGMAELLRESDLTEEQKLYADTIKTSGEALLVIINDVLDFSKIEAAKITLNPEPFDLENMILQIFRLLKPGLAGRDLELRIDYDLFLPDRMIGDQGRIRQILTNLIGNAVKFTETGHVTVRVIGEGVEDGQIAFRIVVEDTGIGIPAEKQMHIFGEFNQVEDQANRRFEGTGLGLAITRQLIRLMGGTIWVESTPGAGSAFGVRLTLDVAEDALVEPLPLPPHARDIMVFELSAPVATRITCALHRLSARVTTGEGEVPQGAAPQIVVICAERPDLADALATRLTDGGFTGPVLLAFPGEAAKTGRPATGAGLLPLPIPVQDLRDRLIASVGAGPPPGDARPARKRPLRLLAAEDNRTNQLVFCKMIQSLNIDLTMVANGREALEAYRASPPDIVFSDVSMPEMDGLEATRLIREHESARGLPRVPVVAMTAHTIEGEDDRIFRAGMDHYMAKPLKKTLILAQIAALAPPDVDLGPDAPPL